MCGSCVAGFRDGLLDKLLPQAAILLHPPELRELAAFYQAEILDADSVRDSVGAASYRLGLLAWALRDPSVFVHSRELRGRELHDRDRKAIAECHLELGDPQGALRWLAEPWSMSDDSRLELRVAAFEALGDRDQMIAERRRIWVRSPSVETYRKLFELLPSGRQKKLRAEALEKAGKLHSLGNALGLYFLLDKPDRAEEALFQRTDQLDGDRYVGLQRFVKTFEQAGRPLAATVIYRALLDSILERAYSRAYRHAADYYRSLDRLAPKIADWRGVANHHRYVRSLVDQHGRKRSFWPRVGGLPKMV